MTDSAQVAADPVPIVTLAIGIAVAVLVGQSVLEAQRDALAQCAPGCDLYGTAAAGVDAVLATPGAVASVWVGPLPLGWLVLAALCLWLLRLVRTPPMI